jgi:hypothetical protein
VAANGSTLFKNSGDSTQALQAQTSGGTQVFDVDTLNQKTIARQSTSNNNTPTLSVQQAGAGSATVELQNSSGSFYLGVQGTNAGSTNSFSINSSVAATSASIIGEDFTTDTNNYSDSNGNEWQATQFTAQASGTISSINAAIDQGAGNAYSLALYDSDGAMTCGATTTCPGTLLAYHSGTGTLAATGGITWNNLAFSGASAASYTVTAGHTYWLALATDNNGTQFWNNCQSPGTSQVSAYRGSITPGTWTNWTSSGASGGGGVCTVGLYANIAASTANNYNNSLFNLTTAGAATFRNQANSSNGFLVQNAKGTNLFNVNTTNNRVEIGVPSNSAAQGDGSATLLVVDSYQSSTISGQETDPSGLNGAIYYNTGGRGGSENHFNSAGEAVGAFRCYSRGEWQNCLGMRDIVERRWGYAAPSSASATTFSAVGALTLGGSTVAGTSSNQAEDNYINFTDAGTSGSVAGIGSGTTQATCVNNGCGSATQIVNVAEARWRPKLVTRIRTDSTITNTRYWVALTAADVTGTNSPATNMMGIRYAAGTDTNWMCVSNNNTTATAADTGILVQASHAYDMILEYDKNGNVQCSVEDATLSAGFGTEAITSTTPTTTTNMGLQETVTSTASSSTRGLSVAYAFLEYGVPDN